MSAVMFDSERNQKIYQAEILPSKQLDALKSHAVPTAIILAGQPGAGKSGVARLSLNDLGKDALIIDLDELRDHYPGVSAQRRAQPYTWSDATHRDAQEWTAKLREDAIKGRKNIILDTTLGYADYAVKLVGDLEKQGYKVEVRAVAAHKLESELGVDQRFAGSLDHNGFGRYVPQKVRDAVYDNLPDSLNAVHAKTDVQVRVYGRNADLVYDNRNPADPRTPGQALKETRDARIADPGIAKGQDDGWQARVDWHESLPVKLQNPAHPAHACADALLKQRDELGIRAGVAGNAVLAATNLAQVNASLLARPDPLPMPAAGAAGHSPPAAASSAHSPPAQASSIQSPSPAPVAHAPVPATHSPPTSASAHSPPAAASSSGPPTTQAAGQPDPIPPTHPLHPVYQALRGQLPGRIDNDKVLEMAVVASTRGGIRTPADIGLVEVAGGRIYVDGRTPGHLTAVAEASPAPPRATLLQQAAAHQEGQQAQQAQAQPQHIASRL